MPVKELRCVDNEKKPNQAGYRFLSQTPHRMKQGINSYLGKYFGGIYIPLRNSWEVFYCNVDPESTSCIISLVTLNSVSHSELLCQ